MAGKAKLPAVSGDDCIRALAKIGFYVTGQKGSHIHLRRDDPYVKFSVPNHKTVYKGTVKNICRLAGLTTDEFNALL